MAMGTKTAIRWDEFLATAKEGYKSEYVDGEVVYMTPVNTQHEQILKRLIRELMVYCDSHPEWDWFPSKTTYTMASGNWRCPDASLLRLDRFPEGKLPEGRVEFAPDVAFEILSPGDKPAEIQRKRKDYQDSGVIQVWIDPAKELVEVIHPDRPLRYFERGQTLILEKPSGFSLAIDQLFPG
jgi:Uma2 family endonuclease